MLLAMRLRSKRGAVSLMAALMVVPVTLTLGSIHVILQNQQDEVQLARAMRLQLQGSLARYDHDLYQQFGVMAVSSSELETEVFKRLNPKRFAAASVELNADNDALSPEWLSQSIGRTMQLRLPLLWVSAFTADFNTNQRDQVSPDATSDLESSSIATAFDMLDGPMAEQLDRLQDQLIDRILNGLREVVEPVVKDTLDDWLDRLDEIGELRSSLSAGSGSLTSLQDLAAILDALSDSPDLLLLHQAQLAEYGVRYLTRAVTTGEANGQLQSLETIAGLSLEKLAESRPAELERIITGLDSAEWAKRLVHSGLVTLRCLVHLADLLQDPERRQQFETLAVAGVLAISAATGGAVNLEPQLLSKLLLVGEAIRLGGADVRQLLAGRSVRFIPGSLSSWNVVLAYHDYLRLLLLVIPQEILLERISKVIRQARPEAFTSSLTLGVTLDPGPGPILLNQSFARRYSQTLAYDQ